LLSHYGYQSMSELERDWLAWVAGAGEAATVSVVENAPQRVR
jgi:hypothetical protein